MKNIILAFAVVVGFSGWGNAASTQAQPVRSIVTNGVTCSTQTITTTASELTGNTTGYTSVPGVYYIAIGNLDTGTTVYASDNSGVAASGLYGWPIAPSPAASQKNDRSWGISVLQKFYAVAASGSVAISKCVWR